MQDAQKAHIRLNWSEVSQITPDQVPWIFGFDFTLNRLDDDVDRRKELWVWMACGKVLDPGGFDHPPPISPFPQCILPTLPVTMR